MHWQTTRYRIDLTRPRVMGIVNVTPDSFSDGGAHADAASAMRHCEQLLREGAELLDIGGESTRPGARVPGADEEARRVLPLLRDALTLGVPISLDTSTPALMRAALDLGVDIINDVRALRRPGALEVLAAFPRAGLCLMHSRGEPEAMQTLTDYGDVVADVTAELLGRLQAVRTIGIDEGRIVLDPGIGFAKTPEQNLAMLARQSELLAFGRPLLVGWSRKSTLGHVSGRPVSERLALSVAAATMAIERGASIVRVHDVAPTVDAVALWCAATAQARTPGPKIQLSPETSP